MTDALEPIALYLSDEALASLQHRLDEAQGAHRLHLMVNLAWHLRQRDCQRALQLATEVADALGHAELDDQQRQALAARLMLVRSEIDWLYLHLNESADMAREALQVFEQIGDLCGRGDTLMHQAALCMERGQLPERDKTMQQAVQCYEQLGDALRVRVAMARGFHYNAFEHGDVTAARIRLFMHEDGTDAPEVMAWLASAQGIVASHAGKLSEAIQHFLAAYESSKRTGQIRNAIGPASNVADSFARLGDLESALEWNNHGLELARINGWPGITSLALSQTGNVLRMLGRQDEAKQALTEALALMEPVQHSTIYALALQYLGELTLDMRQYGEALHHFGMAERRARELNSPIIVLSCLRGASLALVRLGRVAEARLGLDKAMQLAQGVGSADEQIELLRIFAELHDRVVLPPPEGMTAPTPRLHFLLKALALAQSKPGIIESASLHDELGQAYASHGHFEHAYAHALLAAKARAQGQLEEGRTRAKAIQLKQEVARTMAEAQHHREVATLEAQRAATLRQSIDMLEHLADMGRSITLHPGRDDLFESLHHHASTMLDAEFLGIYLLDADGQTLKWAYGRESGQTVQGPDIPLDANDSGFALCARERREVHVAARSPFSHAAIGGSLDTQSLMFMPLLIDEQLFGAISVQSRTPDAYGDREQTLFRALSQYAAIALDLARTAARAEQVDQDRDTFLSRLGQEARSAMNGMLGLLGLMQGTALTERQQDYIDKTSDSARALLDLLNDVLDHARLSRGDLPLLAQNFELELLLRDIANDVAPLLVQRSASGQAAPELLFDIAPDVPQVLRGDAPRLRQLLFNLCSQALVVSGEAEARLEVRLLTQDADSLALAFAVHDLGSPVPLEAKDALFAPFSPLRWPCSGRAGDTGLSLSLAQNLVRLMGGALDLQPGVEQGNILSFQLVMDKPEPEDGAVDTPSWVAPGLEVLIVDDRAATLDALLKLAQGLQWQAEAAADGQEALQRMQDRLRAGQDPFAAVFIDGDMPGWDGWETLARMRQLHEHHPMPLTVMLTAQGRDHLDERSLQEHDGLNGILAKPVTAGMMQDMVQQAFSGQRNLRRRARNRTEQTRPLLGMSLLVAEAQPIHQQVLMEMLGAAGAKVTVVHQGADLLERLRATPQAWDLVLLDLDSPAIDGLRTAKAIRAQPPLKHLPLLATATPLTAADREQSLAAGLNEYLAKPIAAQGLVSKVLRLIGRPAAQSESAPPDADETAFPVLALPDLLPTAHAANASEDKKGGKEGSMSLPALSGEMQAAAAALGLDSQALMRRYLGKAAIYERMVSAFIKTAAGTPAELDHALQSGKLADGALSLHRLKGAAQMLGAQKLAHKLSKGELMFLRGEAPNAAWRQQFAQELMLSIQQLQQYGSGLQSLSAAAPPHTKAA